MRKYYFLISTLLVALTAWFPAWANEAGGYHRGHMWGGGGYGMIVWPIMMILFIGLIVILVVFLVRWFGASGHGTSSHRPYGKTPLDILKERFARGEIDKEEFEERRRLLDE